jgi:restriction endonuclease S subunit
MDTLVGMVPGDWTSCPLKDACDIQSGPSGSVTRTNQKTAAGTGVAVISAQSIGDLTIDVNRLDWVDQRTAERLRRFRLIQGDIVITRIGLEPRHALIGNDQAGALLGGSCLRLRARPGLQPEYLSHYLEHPAVRDCLISQVARTVVATISGSRIGQLPLVFPPDAARQRRVVEILRLVEQDIHAHREIVREGLALRQALLTALMAGADREATV